MNINNKFDCGLPGLLLSYVRNVFRKRPPCDDPASPFAAIHRMLHDLEFELVEPFNGVHCMFRHKATRLVVTVNCGRSLPKTYNYMKFALWGALCFVDILDPNFIDTGWVVYTMIACSGVEQLAWVLDKCGIDTGPVVHTWQQFIRDHWGDPPANQPLGTLHEP